MSPALKAQRLSTIKFLTSDETRRLFGAIDGKRDRAMFLVAYRHGLRASEVGMLRVADVDLKKLRIMVHRVKGSLPGEHPLQPDEAKAIKAWLEAREIDSPFLFTSVSNEPMSRRGLDFLMKQHGRVAKLPADKQHFHVLKHSVATHLLDAAVLTFASCRAGGATPTSRTPSSTPTWNRTRNEKARTFFQRMLKV